MTGKMRVDVAMVQRGLAESREKAQAAIMAGEVYKNQTKVNKASETVMENDEIHLKSEKIPYVSRGALKLEKAVRVFQADLKGKTVVDVGASTGGFTEMCLLNGADCVYAVDVGYGQLDWKLRNDSRVTVMERTNARYLTKEFFPVLPQIAVMDASFISIRLILPALFEILGREGTIYTLIKPQFEAGKEKVGKKGVVRDAQTHIDVIRHILDCVEMLGWSLCQLDYSPITGPEGNIEFLAEIRPDPENNPPVTQDRIAAVVAEAHHELKGTAINHTSQGEE